QADVVVLGRGGRVQAAFPSVPDRGGVGGEGDGGVGAGLCGLAHLVEELLDLFGRAYVADPPDTLLGRRVSPPDPCAETVDAALDVGGQTDPDGRHAAVAGISHDPSPARAPRPARRPGCSGIR